MIYEGILPNLSKNIKFFLASFIIVLSIGYFTGIAFVDQTGAKTPAGIQENYMGNEDNPDAAVMKFKKGQHEMLTILHTHILSISLIFFLLGAILLMTRLPEKLKFFLIIEPFFSIILTFGGIYFMWKGILWMKYIVVFSGTLMTLIFATSVLIILYQLLFLKAPHSDNS